MGTLYTALELGIAAGAIGAGWVVARASYEAMFLLGAAVALVATGLALVQALRGRRP
jgi:predicted MFS family arabinose efflux permease